MHGDAEHEARYEVRREAASAAVIAVAMFAALAFLSWRNGWELDRRSRGGRGSCSRCRALVLCVDLWLGARRHRIRRRRESRPSSCSALIVLGNIVGVGVLWSRRSSTTKNDDLSGGQLLVTDARDLARRTSSCSVSASGISTTAVRSSVRGTSARLRTSDFAQDETPEVARPGWRPRVWDYIFVALTSATAFSPTDTMPLTLKAKLLVGVEEVVSLVLIVLVTARAVSVLGT